MNDGKIYDLALCFRLAIESARDAGEFQKDITFYHFPRGCCGDASYLLAEFLHRHGVETIWVSMEKNGSHAWLVVKDKRVKQPRPTTYSWPKEMWETLRSYGMKYPEKSIDTTHYEKSDLENGLIIDITADQYPDYDIPVYVDLIDPFHEHYNFIQAHDYCGLNDLDRRLEKLYRTIEKCILEE